MRDGKEREVPLEEVRRGDGRMPFRMECRPAFDYARARHDTSVAANAARFDGRGLSLGLAVSVPLRRDGDGLLADFILGEGQDATFVLRLLDPNNDAGRCPGAGEAEDWFRETVTYWQRWLSRCTYHGRWRGVAQRSALALKLLTYEPTGALVAAPTTSLPEDVGGVRNWDYRYTWLRDASFTLYALMRIGFTEEAARFMDWLAARWHEDSPTATAPSG